jgi:hypothetical protein
MVKNIIFVVKEVFINFNKLKRLSIVSYNRITYTN